MRHLPTLQPLDSSNEDDQVPEKWQELASAPLQGLLAFELNVANISGWRMSLASWKQRCGMRNAASLMCASRHGRHAHDGGASLTMVVAGDVRA